VAAALLDFCFSSNRGCCCHRRCGRRHHWRGHLIRDRAAVRAIAGNAYGLLAFLDFQLIDAGFLEQLNQLLDLANVHAWVALLGDLR
jgi:hypothetical protein